MLSLIFLLVYLAAGCLCVRFLLPHQRVPVRIWLGASFGLFLMMWLPALMAFFIRFTLTAQVLSLILLGAVVAACYFLRDRICQVRPFDKADKRFLITLALTALPLTVLGGYLQFTHVLRPVGGGLNVGQSTYGDLPLHLGIISGLREMPFPPEYTILPGENLTYPFLVDSLSTSLMLLELPLRWAAIIPGTLMMALVYTGYMILASRIASSRKAAVLAFFFLFINGGLGFLYSMDTLGVSNGNSTVNPLQAGTWLQRLTTILHGWYQTPANHADFSYYNLRWSNIIVDMLVPQRTFLGGWCILLPCIYLLYDGVVAHADQLRVRPISLLAVMTGGLPFVHTHSFLALGLLSIGWMIYCLLRRGRFLPWLLFGGVTCFLAAPQLFLWIFRHTSGNSGFVKLQFNWVNNSGGRGLQDGYLWFYLKNIGLPALLLICSLMEKNTRRRRVAAGAFVIFIAAELIVFQPNEYDNNKLFYVWWALCAIPAAEYVFDLIERLRPLRSRIAIIAVGLILCFTTGTLSIARECISDYQMFSRGDVETADFVENYTPQDATFICWTQHINPISVLAGRRIVCGPGLWLAMHGYDLAEREDDIRAFYADPVGRRDVLEKYDVDFIAVGEYERANMTVDEEMISQHYPLVYRAQYGSMRIYAAVRPYD